MSDAIGPPCDSDLAWHREHCGDFYCNCRDEDSDEVEHAEDMAEEWRWGYIHGYLHGWKNKTAGRQYGEGRNFRKPSSGGPGSEPPALRSGPPPTDCADELAAVYRDAGRAYSIAAGIRPNSPAMSGQS